MLDARQHDPNPVGIAETRGNARLPLGSLAYIELTDENAGVILNISETGIAVQAVQVLTSDSFPRMRFRLPKTEDLIDVAGRVVWQVQSKKVAGIEFLDLPEETTGRIAAWIAAEQRRSSSTKPTVSRDDPPEEEHLVAENGEQSEIEPLHDVSPARSSWNSPSAGPVGSGEMGDASDWAPESGHSLDAMFPSESEAKIGIPELVRAVPRFKEQMAGSDAEVSRPQRWWTYAVLIGVVAVLGFAAGILFTRDTTPSRIEALNAVHSNRVKNTERRGENREANSQRRLNSTSPLGPSQKLESPSSAQPGPRNTTGTSASASAPALSLSPALPPTADVVKNSAPSAVQRSGSGANSSVGASGTARDPYQAKRGSAENRSQGRVAQNPAATYRPRNTYSAAATEQPHPPASQAGDTSRDRSAYTNRTSRAPVDSAETPTTSQNGEARSSRSVQTQQPSALQAANRDAAELREQAPASSKPAANADGARVNQQTAQRDQQLPAQTAADPTSTSGAAGGSSHPAGQTSSPGTPVPPNAPLSIPSGSASATSQFHGFIIPLELQSASSQLAGQLRIGQPVSTSAPGYPTEAAREGVQGTVTLDVTVGRDGTVKNVRAISGPTMLTPVAAAAVRDWRYEQTLVAGEPVEAREYVRVVFKLAGR